MLERARADSGESEELSAPPAPEIPGAPIGSMHHYALALAGVAAAVVAMLLEQSAIGGRPLLILLMPPVSLAAAFGGFRLGGATTLAGIVAAIAVSLSAEIEFRTAALEIAAITAVGLVCSWFGERRIRLRQEGNVRTAALIAERAHIQSILDTSPDAVMVIDNAGILQSFNRASERLFGYSADEVLGRNIKMIMPAPYREQHDEYIARYLRTGERRIIGIGRVVTGLRKDGRTVPLELAVGEVNTPNGRYFTGFIRDLTERHEADARLQDLQAELTHISRLSAMGEMASTLAHELNQPLSAVANYLRGTRRFLERGETDVSMLAEALDKASNQALRAGDIIRRLRDFVARGETEKSVGSLSNLVEEATALALVGAKERGVEVRYRFDPKANLVIADRVQIQQVLVNLVRNAIDAMEHSERREVLIASRPAPDEMVEVSVTDTGSGLSPEVKEGLFRPFFTTKSQGMGVGLSICRTIVESHGGRIWAEANPKGGTIFRFTLPVGSLEHVDGE